MFDKIKKVLKETEELLPTINKILLELGTTIAIIKMLIDSFK